MSASAPTRRFRALLGKEFRQILRDQSTFLIAFVLPVVLMFLMGFGVNLDPSQTRIGLALQDDGGAARSLAETYDQSPYFQVTKVGTVTQLKPDLVAGSIRAIVVIPADFSREAARGGGTIQVLADGSFPNQAGFIVAYAEGLRATWAAERLADAGRSLPVPIDIDARYWFNAELESSNFLVPGAIAVVMTMIGSLLTALVVAREWERGTMESLMATPIGMSQFLATKVVAYLALGLGSMALCTVLALTVFEVPLRGSVLALLAIGVTYLLPALGLGLFISAAMRNQFVASQVALITAFLPTLLLSNFVFEISSMPKPIQLLTYIVPARYVIPQLQTVFLAGDDWALFLPNMAILLGFALVLFTLCRHVTQRRIA